MASIDYDEWAKLFKENPEEFERRRKEEIDKVISAVCPAELQHRLRQLQWKIDMERDAAANPMAALVKIQEMMWDSFLKMNGKLQEFAGKESPPEVVREAKVLVFKRKANESVSEGK